MEIAEGVHLVRAFERAGEVSALGSRLGGPVGLPGVLSDLNRTAALAAVPGRAPVWGFTWDAEDNRSRRWFPQGITTSADHGDLEQVGGRRLVCTSWYSRNVGGLGKGARITFVDITSRAALRYRHVLLVEPVATASGLDVRPVAVHAGGIVWHGDYLHVAASARGVYSFRVDDIVRVPTSGDPSSLGLTSSGRVDGFGYRYLLPVRFRYAAFADDGHRRMRYSFLSLDRSASPNHLVAGEYGRGAASTRLVRFELDPATSLPRSHPDGSVRPLALCDSGVQGMQGAAVVDGRYFVTTSSGPRRHGSLLVGRPGAFTRHANVLPVGPEDLAYWPSRDELWSLTEYPARRYVFAMNRAEFTG